MSKDDTTDGGGANANANASNDANNEEAFMTIGIGSHHDDHDVPIYFSEDWNTGIGGGLWSTGLAMARYFEHHAEDVVANLRRLKDVKKLALQQARRQQQQFDNVTSANAIHNKNSNNDNDGEGISAMELGSGNGFLSVCLLALLLAAANNKDKDDDNNQNQNNQSQSSIPPPPLLKELVVTDMADHLSLMAKTLRANPHVWKDLTVVEPPRQDGDDFNDAINDDDGRMTTQTPPPSSSSSAENSNNQNACETVIVAEHLWGEFSSSNNENKNDIHDKKYDFIFGTDLAYRNSLHAPLIASLDHFSHANTLILIGVTMTDTQPIFFDALTKAGFRYEKLADGLLEKEFRGGNSFGIVAIQRR